MDWPKNWHFLQSPNQNWEKWKKGKSWTKMKGFLFLNHCKCNPQQTESIQKLWSKTFYCQQHSFIKRILSWVQEKTLHFILMFINHTRIVFYCFLKTPFFGQNLWWKDIHTVSTWWDSSLNGTRFYIQQNEVCKQRSRLKKKSPIEH